MTSRWPVENATWSWRDLAITSVIKASEYKHCSLINFLFCTRILKEPALNNQLKVMLEYSSPVGCLLACSLELYHARVNPSPVCVSVCILKMLLEVWFKVGINLCMIYALKVKCMYIVLNLFQNPILCIRISKFVNLSFIPFTWIKLGLLDVCLKLYL